MPRWPFDLVDDVRDAVDGEGRVRTGPQTMRRRNPRPAPMIGQRPLRRTGLPRPRASASCTACSTGEGSAISWIAARILLAGAAGWWVRAHFSALRRVDHRRAVAAAWVVITANSRARRAPARDAMPSGWLPSARRSAPGPRQHPQRPEGTSRRSGNRRKTGQVNDAPTNKSSMGRSVGARIRVREYSDSLLARLLLSGNEPDARRLNWCDARNGLSAQGRTRWLSGRM